MKKTLGIILILTSITILTWCFWAHPYTLMVRLLINIVGFAGFSFGFLLLGYNVFGMGKTNEPFERKEERKNPTKKEPEKVELKKFEEEDHDKYKPK